MADIIHIPSRLTPDQQDAITQTIDALALMVVANCYAMREVCSLHVEPADLAEELADRLRR